MASRNIADAHEILQKQYEIAKKAFEAQYPQVKVILTATYRSGEEQNALYAQPHDGKDNNGNGKVDEASEKVTNAKAGQSPHNFLPSYAIDVAFIVNGKMDWDTKWFKLFSTKMIHPQIVWGGTWKFIDHPHFEIRGWKDLINKK